MLQKQPITINFAQGLNTKTDPWQVPAGQFLSLVNSVFTKGGMLKKRNGYGSLPSLTSDATYTTTLNGNLTAVGSNISALNADSSAWVQKGFFQQLQISTLSLIKNGVNQTQCDAAIAPNGLVCTVYTETNAGSTSYKYAIADGVTGQNIIAPTPIPVSTGTVTGSPRVFMLNGLFVIVFTNVITATSHLQYIAISSANPTIVTANKDIASAYTSAATLSWDGVVAPNDNLYLAYNTTAGGQSIKVTYLPYGAAIMGQSPASPVTFAGQIATMVSMCIDESVPAVVVSYYDSAGSTGKMLAVGYNLTTLMPPTNVITSGSVLNLASASLNRVCRLFYEVANNYSYDGAIPTHYVAFRDVTIPMTVTTGAVNPAAGSAASGTPSMRSVGLASKAFLMNDVKHYLAVYKSPYQSTFFLINGEEQLAIARLGYQNAAAGYLTLGLPGVTISDSIARIPYLIADFLAADTTVSATPVSGAIPGFYTQTGISLADFDYAADMQSVEIANSLNLSGGFLWQYDGYLPVENNFFLFPDSVEVTTSTMGGSLTAQDYFYVATYEWQDNQGLTHRSAPSIAVKQTTTGGTSSNTVNVPYLRITHKIANPPNIVIYRWSTAQQVFHRITSLTSAQVNSITTDSLAFVDTLADSAIAGNDILYTTGGVVENIGGPGFDSVFLFDDRVWGINSENKNLLSFSKQVIDGTPVEMSDLLTYYVAPSAGAQGPTGPLRCGAPMDDKAILFKDTAISYINGTGPDNTGNNSGYPATPIFITSTVGCSNQRSIVFTPSGLMFEFQSEAGNQIWLLGRDLQTQYIGAAVEEFTQNATVDSAVNIPGTNQVRFTLSSGITLMFDYFYNQWGTFSGVPAISSCVYKGVQAYINSFGQAFQETPGVYVDGSRPVLMSFVTSWLKLAGLQGYQRAHFFYVLARYFSPHKMYFQVAYDFNPSPLHSTLITPTNFSPVYGGDGDDEENPYGQQGKYGGPTALENERIFFKKQRCQSFQLTFNEVFDGSLGIAPGAGLTMSGLNVIASVKSGFRTIASRHSSGLG